MTAMIHRAKIQRDDLVQYCDHLLEASAFRDACPNGLQVHGQDQVALVATCTSVSDAFFTEAIRAGAQLVLVHHGLFWNGDERIIDPLMGGRLGRLLTAGMNLLAYHLPLDAHPTLGNNAQLANLLDLGEPRFDLGHIRGRAVGCRGRLPKSLSSQELAHKLDQALGGTSLVLPQGDGVVEQIGILSGSGGDLSVLLEAKRLGVELLVTGNLHEQSVAAAKELGLSLVACGHYNSEKLGVRALGDQLAAHFDIQVMHVDVPNPV